MGKNKERVGEGKEKEGGITLNKEKRENVGSEKESVLTHTHSG